MSTRLRSCWIRALLGDLNAHADEPLIVDAVEEGEHLEWIKALLGGGADPKARRRRDGVIALHAAVGAGTVGKDAEGILAALIEAGADPGARDDDGRTPWELLQRNRALKRELRDTAVWRQLEEADSASSD